MPDSANRTDSKRVVLAADGVEVFTPSQAPTDNGHGQPVQSFVKDLIPVGVYHGETVQGEFEVTADRIDNWLAAFNALADSGVEISVVKNHSDGAEDKLGTLRKVYRVGDRLYGVHEIVGEDAIDLVERVQSVSVAVGPVTDGQGKSYDEAIVHSSVSTQTVVPEGQQRSFVPIAAARGAMGPSVYILSSGEGESEMTEEQLKQLAALLGVDAGELTAETAFDKLTEWDKGRREADAKREEEIGSLKKQVEALKAANPNSEPQLDADTADMLAEGVESGLEQLVTASKLTPAARDKLQPLLVGQPGQPAVRMLSRAATGGAKSVARQIIEALQGNDPVELGEQSRSQAVRLSRQVPDDQGPEYDPEITKEMAAMAGVPSADS